MARTMMWEFTDNGFRFWRESDDGNVIEEVRFNPTSNGKGEIGFTTSDGTTKKGEVEPGSASDKGIGN